MYAEIIEWMDYPRQCGKTTALAEAANKLNGIFVVSTDMEVKKIKKRFPDLDVRTLSVNLIGVGKPMIFDHRLITRIVYPLVKKIKDIKKILEE